MLDLHRIDVDAFRNLKKTPLVIVLDNVRSEMNVGSVLRTADAFAVEQVCLCGITGTPPRPEIHKTALGAEDSVDWKYYHSTLNAIDDLRARGFEICAVEQVHNSISLSDFHAENGKKYAIIFGNEVKGVEQAAVDAADCCIEIPQLGTKHSLNIANSVAIVTWHLFLQLSQ